MPVCLLATWHMPMARMWHKDDFWHLQILTFSPSVYLTYWTYKYTYIIQRMFSQHSSVKQHKLCVSHILLLNYIRVTQHISHAHKFDGIVQGCVALDNHKDIYCCIKVLLAIACAASNSHQSWFLIWLHSRVMLHQTNTRV